jgi:hypothetical protein
MDAIVVYIDTETDFGWRPLDAATVQIGVHSPQLGLDIRLGGDKGLPGKRCGGELWVSAFRIIQCLVRSRDAGAVVLVLAHNGFNFDFMNMITEFGSDPEIGSWIRSESVRFGDTMEVMMREFQRRPPPQSFSLDSLYAMFMGRKAIIPNRHDALEDARALCKVIDASGARVCDPDHPPASWSDLVAMHRSWSVRDALLKNPSRPIPVPRVFSVVTPPASDDDSATNTPSDTESVTITLFKIGDEPGFTATIGRRRGPLLYVCCGNVNDRCKGLPGRMRAWAQVLRNVGRGSQMASGAAYDDHPLMSAGGLACEPICLLPDDTRAANLLDGQSDAIRGRLERQNSTATGFTPNAEDAIKELADSCALMKRCGIAIRWTTM